MVYGTEEQTPRALMYCAPLKPPCCLDRLFFHIAAAGVDDAGHPLSFCPHSPTTACAAPATRRASHYYDYYCSLSLSATLSHILINAERGVDTQEPSKLWAAHTHRTHDAQKAQIHDCECCASRRPADDDEYVSLPPKVPAVLCTSDSFVGNNLALICFCLLPTKIIAASPPPPGPEFVRLKLCSF